MISVYNIDNDKSDDRYYHIEKLRILLDIRISTFINKAPHLAVIRFDSCCRFGTQSPV